MKAAFPTSASRIEWNFPVLLTMTAIACLLAIQSLGVNVHLSIATACATLVFCARRVIPSTWEVLINAYLLRTSRCPK